MKSSADGLRLVVRRFKQEGRIERAYRMALKRDGVEPGSVVIRTYSGLDVRVDRPKDWLAVMEECYRAFRGEVVCDAVREWCNGAKSATVAAELNGMTRRVFYERQRVFFGYALALARERGLVTWDIPLKRRG